MSRIGEMFGGVFGHVRTFSEHRASFSPFAPAETQPPPKRYAVSTQLRNGTPVPLAADTRGVRPRRS
jgi:hypothetical protein